MLARDHLRTLQYLLNGDVMPTWRLLSISRVAVESSARAWWMLAPVNGADRTARAVLTQLDMLENRRRLEAGAGNAEERMNELARDADDPGLAVEFDKKGHARWVNGHTSLYRTASPPA